MGLFEGKSREEIIGAERKGEERAERTEERSTHRRKAEQRAEEDAEDRRGVNTLQMANNEM